MILIVIRIMFAVTFAAAFAPTIAQTIVILTIGDNDSDNVKVTSLAQAQICGNEISLH